MGAAPLPFVSILIPTLNSGRTLEPCLAAIRTQDYPPDRLEIILADAGSTDDTLAVAHRFDPILVVPNPLRTGEAGKSAALAHAHGDLIALIDSDNILPSPDWLRRMVAPFSDPSVFAAEPLHYECRPSDPALTRYFALLGMNDPICLFTGNYDRTCAITGRWTALPIPTTPLPNGDLLLDLPRECPLPTLGANGTLLRRSVLSDATTSPYYFDIDVVQQLVQAGHTRFVKVDLGIVHLYAGRLRDFSRKQHRRIQDFLHFRRSPSNTATRTYSWRRSGALRGIVLFSLSTLTLLPLLIHMILGARRHPDRAWAYHIPVCWITLVRYASAVLLLPFRATRPASRDHWQKD